MDQRRSEDPGRRGEDKRWAHVQAQLATTKQAVDMLYATVSDLKDELRTFDASVYGSSRDKDSIHFRLKQVEQKTQELHMVVIDGTAKDPSLMKIVGGMSYTLGTFHDTLVSLSESKKDRNTRITAVIVAAITTLGLVFTNLDKLAVGVEQLRYVFRQEPLTAESVTRDIEQLRKTRGPEVNKILKELARRGRR